MGQKPSDSEEQPVTVHRMVQSASEQLDYFTAERQRDSKPRKLTVNREGQKIDSPESFPESS
ncbi:hypothetical protein [Glutamicibacter sp.]|uniref:hypothetical protein n=1 Tax=Glutamicibacter sp. TaxID=1931995 RepID=UPI0028BE781F|nr:hypothetical protein [Glutamicibacter sp.]